MNNKQITILLLCELLVLCAFGLYAYTNRYAKEMNGTQIATNKEENDVYVLINTIEYIESALDFEPEIKEKIDSLSTREKIKMLAVEEKELNDLFVSIDCLRSEETTVGNRAEELIEEIELIHESNRYVLLSNFPNKEVKSFEDLILFQAAIDAGADAIFINGDVCNAITGDDLPCDQSENTIDVIRGRMGFDGLLICNGNEEAIDKFGAGVDLLIVDNEQLKELLINMIESVCKNNEIMKNHLDNSVGRLLRLN